MEATASQGERRNVSRSRADGSFFCGLPTCEQAAVNLDHELTCLIWGELSGAPDLFWLLTP